MAEASPVPSHTINFSNTPPPPNASNPVSNSGIRLTKRLAIKNAPLPADGPGNDNFSNGLLLSFLILVPAYLTYQLGGGSKTWIFISSLTATPLLIAYWMFFSSFSPRKNEKVTLPNLSIEKYLTFHREQDKRRYCRRTKIPIETFHEMYFDGHVDFNGDALEILEYRHDWASFRFTINLIWFFFTGMLPQVIFHTRSQDEEQVRDHYDRGDDFYSWYLGPRMIYTSGVISDPDREESLEQLQDNKLAVVCEKIGLEDGDTMLDIGCGWGTLAKYASTEYGAHVTGITLGRNQTVWGNNSLQEAGVPQSQSKILCLDYRDIPAPKSGFKKITCLEMAEHVGVRHFSSFLSQVYDMLDDDGVFFLQIAGLRKSWQFEDLIWGLFMNKYVFPGADASTPLGFFVDKLEKVGFEVKNVDTIGIHYSATLWRWYRNWVSNKEKVIAKYGNRWYRIWEFFLAWSTIISRQGSATCYQITLVKNINSTHRVDGISRQFNLSGALASAQRRQAGLKRG